ncbi:hypothetical protein LSTR_LSTR004828 [Laodelphax striatellus]|uniref:Uncharacterized protein n=1 Tax=Laodelphax striatellus TaxID=195883 RepID=A0A482WIR1_LAOST|nr:hypothetical protein LSTR_LSTR004828 [Laodelphax striatellus]
MEPQRETLKTDPHGGSLLGRPNINSYVNGPVGVVWQALSGLGIHSRGTGVGSGWLAWRPLPSLIERAEQSRAARSRSAASAVSRQTPDREVVASGVCGWW